MESRSSDPKSAPTVTCCCESALLELASVPASSPQRGCTSGGLLCNLRG